MAEKQAPGATLLEFPEGHGEPHPAGGLHVGLSAIVGAIAGQRDDALLVDFPGNPGDPVPARSIVALDPTIIGAALRDQQGVLLLFDGGRLDAPIIVGLLQAPVPLTPESVPDMPTEDMPTEALVDGKRVAIEGADEISLRCGKASITLRRNGRVVIRGTYVETRSSGVNRVKGGSVEIN